MNKRTAIPIIRFFILLFLQVGILNNMSILGYITPYAYLLTLLLLPVNLPHWIIIFSGFFLGLSVGAFTNDAGIHAAATTFIAFLRPSILKAIAPSIGYDDDAPISPFSQGYGWFVFYLTIIVLIHHIILFGLEIMSFQYPLYLFSKIFFSTIYSVACMFAFSLFTSSNKRR